MRFHLDYGLMVINDFVPYQIRDRTAYLLYFSMADRRNWGMYA